jgi:hypothetical protein
MSPTSINEQLHKYWNAGLAKRELASYGITSR